MRDGNMFTMKNVLLNVLTTVINYLARDFDHQRTSYFAQIVPFEITQRVVALEINASSERFQVLKSNRAESIYATPFFSPESSEDALVSMINEAEEVLDIYAPSVKFWYYERAAARADAKNGKDAIEGKKCGGLLPSVAIERETFPVFRALLNAVRARNVTVRVLTNKYDDEGEACDGRVTMKDFLALANPEKMEVRYYRTTSFMHAKFVNNGKKISVSSVNWSKESLRMNREVGVILEGGVEELHERVSKRAFENDWSKAFAHERNVDDISESERKIITDNTPVAMLNNRNNDDKKKKKKKKEEENSINAPFVTKMERIALSEGSTVEFFVSPDFSRETLINFLRSAKSVIYIYTYQITDDEIADTLVELSNKGIKVFLMLSPRIYADWDRKKATEVQSRLNSIGSNIVVHSSPKNFRYSHLKFILIDDRSNSTKSFRTLVMTGNLSPSDFPIGNTFRPCFGKASCPRANRDINVLFQEQDGKVASKFLEVYSEDSRDATVYVNPTKY